MSKYNSIELHCSEDQIDIILRGLELYAYNYHYLLSDVMTDTQEIKNCFLFHTYEQILSACTNYKRGYDVSKYFEDSKTKYNLLEQCKNKGEYSKRYNYDKKRKKH